PLALTRPSTAAARPAPRPSTLPGANLAADLLDQVVQVTQHVRAGEGALVVRPPPLEEEAGAQVAPQQRARQKGIPEERLPRGVCEQHAQSPDRVLRGRRGRGAGEGACADVVVPVERGGETPECPLDGPRSG